jgi:hypothetical protein
MYQPFMKYLKETWLGKSQNNLRELDLGLTEWVGFSPKLDLRGLKFGRLQILRLTGITFIHQWQVDWICSHSPTLHTLSLEECAIIVQATTSMAIDHESYPIEDQVLGGAPSVLTFHLRWSDIYEQFRTRLPNLRVFEQSTVLVRSHSEPKIGKVVGCTTNRYLTYEMGIFRRNDHVAFQVDEEWNSDTFAYDRLQDTLQCRVSGRARMSRKALRERRG